MLAAFWFLLAAFHLLLAVSYIFDKLGSVQAWLEFALQLERDIILCTASRLKIETLNMMPLVKYNFYFLFNLERVEPPPPPPSHTQPHLSTVHILSIIRILSREKSTWCREPVGANSASHNSSLLVLCLWYTTSRYRTWYSYASQCWVVHLSVVKLQLVIMVLCIPYIWLHSSGACVYAYTYWPFIALIANDPP